MLSMLVMPSQHPFPWIDIPDAETRAYYEEYDDHPVTHWVKQCIRIIVSVCSAFN
jgi:hypothetical protein